MDQRLDFVIEHRSGNLSVAALWPAVRHQPQRQWPPRSPRVRTASALYAALACCAVGLAALAAVAIRWILR